MKLKLGHRSAMVAAVAAMAVGGVAAMTTSAFASASIILDTSHGVGLYSGPSSAYGKAGADLSPGDGILATCWTTGQDIDNLGDVWYKTSEVLYLGGPWVGLTAYTYAPYVDNNATFHEGVLPHC